MLDSALASAVNTLLYGDGDVYDVAAAYAFHIAEFQCFFDGNKRTAIGSAIVFLEINGVSADGTREIERTLLDAMIAISSHALDKAGLAKLFRTLFQK